MFLLETHGWRILFAGDAGFNTERILLRSQRGALKADLIIRGSHSSDHCSTPDFLAAVQPSAVIVNARNFEDGAPGDDRWRKAMLEARIELFDQEQGGAISVEIDPGQLVIRSFTTDQSLTLKRAR